MSRPPILAVLLSLGVVISGCVQTASLGGPASEGHVPLGSGSTVRFRAEGEFTIHHAAVCAPVEPTCVGAFSPDEGAFRAPPRGMRGVADVEWDAVNPTTERLRVALGGDGGRLAAEAEGVSPIRLRFDADPDERLRVRVGLAPPGGYASEQRVRWVATEE